MFWLPMPTTTATPNTSPMENCDVLCGLLSAILSLCLP